MTNALELTRTELACAIETLAAAGDAGHDANGRPLNGTLRAGIAKLRRLWQLRYDTRAPAAEAIGATELRTAFAEAGEVFPKDLSAAVVTLTQDMHFDCDLTLGVAVFGKAGMEEAPIWEVEHKGEAHLMAVDCVDESGCISATFLRSLFATELRQLLSARSATISYNPMWPSAAELDPCDEEQDITLVPEKG